MTVLKILQNSFRLCLHNELTLKYRAKGLIHVFKLNRGVPFLLRARRDISTKRVPPKLRRKKGDFGASGYFLLAIPITTFILGTWQIHRRRWKLDLLEFMETRKNAAPVNLPENVSDLQDMEYCKVHVLGTFDHSKEVYIGPKSLIVKGEVPNAGLFSGGKQGPGVHIVTPFQLSNRNLTILVNRGWVPKTQLNPKAQSERQVEGEIAIVGVVRHTEKMTSIQKTTEHTNTWLYRDIDSIAEKCGTAPIFIDADVESTMPGGPIGGQTLMKFRNDHLSYILTWYSLCAATSYLWFQKFIRRLPASI